MTAQLCPAPPVLEDLTFLVLEKPKVNENGEAEPSQDRSSSSSPRPTSPKPSGLFDRYRTVGETETALVCLQQPRHSRSTGAVQGWEQGWESWGDVLGMCLEGGLGSNLQTRTEGHSMPSLFCI